jgi:hypothetical protein
MVTLSDALRIAQAYIAQMNQDDHFHPNYQYEVSKPEEYAHCWYFNYLIQPRPNCPVDKKEMFAGAPGLVIPKETGKPKTIDWNEMQELAAWSAIWRECELTSSALQSANFNLATLRAHLSLPLPEIVAFKKELDLLGADELARKQALKTKLLQSVSFPDEQ